MQKPLLRDAGKTSAWLSLNSSPGLDPRVAQLRYEFMEAERPLAA